MRRRTLVAAAASGAVAALTSGCASTGTPIDPKDASRSLVYGYIDGKDAPSKIRWVQVKQYGDRDEGQQGYYLIDYTLSTGLFFHVGIEKGNHQVHKFGNDGTHYNWSNQGRNATALRIERPGAYFLGAYKYVHHDGGWLGQDKFEMQPLRSPTEAEVLALVLRRLETDADLATYVHQRTLAQQRLVALGGRRV
jgi:hypothetical protein